MQVNLKWILMEMTNNEKNNEVFMTYDIHDIMNFSSNEWPKPYETRCNLGDPIKINLKNLWVITCDILDKRVTKICRSVTELWRHFYESKSIYERTVNYPCVSSFENILNFAKWPMRRPSKIHSPNFTPKV